MNNEPVIIFDGPSVEVKKDLICFQDYFDAMMKSGYTREEAQDRYAVTAADVCRGLYVVRRDPATIGEMYFHLLVFRDLCDKFNFEFPDRWQEYLAEAEIEDRPKFTSSAYRQYYAVREMARLRDGSPGIRRLGFGNWTQAPPLQPMPLHSVGEGAENAGDAGPSGVQAKFDAEQPKDKDKSKERAEPLPDPPKNKGKEKAEPLPEPPKPEPPKGEPEPPKSESKPESGAKDEPGKSATSMVLPERPKVKSESGKPQVEAPEAGAAEGSQEKRAWADIPKPKVKSRAKKVEPAAPPKQLEDLPGPKFLAQHKERQDRLKREAEQKLAAERATKEKQRLLEAAAEYEPPKYQMSLEDRSEAWRKLRLPTFPDEEAAGPFELNCKSSEWVYKYCFGHKLAKLGLLSLRAHHACAIWFEHGPNGHHTRLVVGLKHNEPITTKLAGFMAETWVAFRCWRDSGNWDNLYLVHHFREQARKDVIDAVERLHEHAVKRQQKMAARQRARVTDPHVLEKRALEQERDRREKGAKADEARLRKEVAGKVNPNQPPQNIAMGIAAWFDKARSEFLSRDRIAELAKEEWCQHTARLEEALARAHREEAESWFAGVREPESDDEDEGEGEGKE
ncbi:hypothetical protein VTJ04DRAFT_4104 [Mycothermus thermophilus]|uniref:uncharacterized protein n=1 Tax=Humicola insolens TaxID=85995 RepID=UPI00374398F2